MKNNVITPIQKVILFQYNNKSYFEKFVYWLQYYLQWVYCWMLYVGKKCMFSIEKSLKDYSSQNEWVANIRKYLEEKGVVEKQTGKRRRPKAANEMLEFVEVEYEYWESKVEQKMKKENRESLAAAEEKEERERGNWGSMNIEAKYYDKEEFEHIYTQIIMEPDNEEELKWKRRVMIVWVPMIGNIMMYYDVFRMCFAYYSDTQGINYNILNACAMRYVRMFHCMDLFMDEMVELRFLNNCDSSSDGYNGGGQGQGEEAKKRVEYWKSPLRWMNKTIEQFHLENESGEGKEGGHRGIYGTAQKKKDEGKGIKLEKEEREKLFAKLKQYRTEYVPEKEIKLRNRFVYKGRTRDSCYSVFAKKVPEVKVVHPKAPLDTKSAFFSGLLPLKLPKFWEVEEQEILGSKYMEKAEESGGENMEDGGREEKEDKTEVSSYLEYKRKMGIK